MPFQSGKLLLLLLLVSLSVSLAPAQQSPSGNINGRLSDGSGAVIPGVAVTLKSPAIQGEQNTVTDEAGNYRFILLPPGTFTLTFELPGFKTLVREEVIVSIGKTTTINATLEVATQAETVTVTGESPVVDVTATTLGVNLDHTILKGVLGPRDQWVVLATIPGIRMTDVDVGGSHMGQSTGYQAYGMSGQNWQTVDGVTITCFYNDFGAVAEIQVSAAGNSAEMATPGASLNQVLKTGGNQLHGELYADYENGSMQGTNLTEELKDKGIAVGDRFKSYHDYNFNAGGPIKRDKLWWFMSYRDNYSATRTEVLQNDGTPGGVYWLVINNIILKMNYQANAKNQLAMTLQYNDKYQPVRNSQGPNAKFYNMASTYTQDGPFWIATGSWTSTLNNQTTLSVAANNYGYHIVDHANVEQSRRIDRFTGLIRGGHPTHTLYLRNLWEGKSDLSYYAPSLLGGTHNLKLGFGNRDHGNRQKARGAIGDPGTLGHVTLYYNNGVPLEFSTDSAPYTFRPAVRQTWFFAQDKWQIGRRLTVNLGLRYDRQGNYYPAGGNPGTGPFAQKSEYPRTVVKIFNDWVSRFGLVLDVFGNTRTALKLNYGRFAENPGYSISSAVIPGSAITRTYRWDGSFPITPEVVSRSTLTNVSGQTNPVAVDPNMKNPYVDEYLVGIDHEVFADFGVHASFVRKIQHGAWGTINRADPLLGYAPVQALDPGKDGVYRTADDRQITVFEKLTPVVSDLYLSTFDQGSNYSSVEFSVTKRMSSGWQMLAGFDWTKRNLAQSITTNPNTLVYGGRTHTPLWTTKFLASYELPKGITVHGNLQVQKGEPYGRTTNVTTAALVGRTTPLRQGTITGLQMEPTGTYYRPPLPELDF
ncbi:MAG: TonB-dependent receptor, partial [Acidobacteria bacterium]|nr:TonB-dependent receptor [Acidobacteriota bacterium]